MRLLATFTDYHFLSTIKQSIKEIEEGKDIIIYPEDSTNGYKEQLTYLHPGFASLCEMLYQKGKDVPIYVTYLNKRKNLSATSDSPKIDMIIQARRASDIQLSTLNS